MNFSKASLGLALAVIVFLTIGCGETLRGAGRDVSRIGRGVKTIFISD